MKTFALAVVGLSLIANLSLAQTFGPDDSSSTTEYVPTFFSSENPTASPEPTRATEPPTYPTTEPSTAVPITRVTEPSTAVPTTRATEPSTAVPTTRATEPPTYPTTVPTTTFRPTRTPTDYVNSHCNFTACKEPNCVCLSDLPPKNLDPANIPQFVTITFDGAITVTNFPYYQALFNYKNPSGCPIESTYFVSHVDTNYKLVHELHRHGNEIGVHSISKSKNNYQDYWRKLALDGWKAEFGGQRRILSKYASIPIEDIKGGRAPNLQTAGNVTFTALASEKFTYDCSNPSRKGVKTPFFPYTLDYGFQRDNDCQVAPCLKLTDVYPAFWDVPMNDLNVEYVVNNVTINRECATAAACILFDSEGNYIPVPTAEQIFVLLDKNFKRYYNGNRAPFPIYLNEDWIGQENHRKGLFMFIEKILENKDVYVVAIDSLIDWMKNSVTLEDYSKKSCKPIQTTACQLDKDESMTNHCDYINIGELNGLTKRMVICDDVTCPAKYPWTNQES